jgi:serine/threonine-protein kinase RIO1
MTIQDLIDNITSQIIEYEYYTKQMSQVGCTISAGKSAWVYDGEKFTKYEEYPPKCPWCGQEIDDRCDKDDQSNECDRDDEWHLCWERDMFGDK